MSVPAPGNSARQAGNSGICNKRRHVERVQQHHLRAVTVGECVIGDAAKRHAVGLDTGFR